MKRNVDLTTNKVFYNRLKTPNALVDIMGHHFLPWSFDKMRVVTSEYELDEPLALFHCGNATQRQKLREWAAYESGLFCERCGAKRTDKPWAEFHGFLCERCNRELNQEFDRKWRFKEENIVAVSRDFLVIEMNRSTI